MLVLMSGAAGHDPSVIPVSGVEYGSADPRRNLRGLLAYLRKCMLHHPRRPVDCSVQADYAHSHGLQDRLGAVPGVELLVNRSQMVLDGLLADVELLADLAR